jgi:hypothetical protein
MLIYGPPAADALPCDRLAHGEAVPGAPGACARPGCAHSMPWHTPANPRRPCERCGCRAYARTGCLAASAPHAPPVQGVLF